MTNLNPQPFPSTSITGHAARRWPAARIFVWTVWLLMTIIALGDTLFTHAPRQYLRPLIDIAALAAAAAVFITALHRVRLPARTRFADAFFPLVLLNPLLYAQHPSAAQDTTLLATGLLGLMAGAIIAMRRDNRLRYFAVAALSLALALIAKTFLLLAPPLVAWFLITGFLLARSDIPRNRVRGFVIMALGEMGLLLFGLACILEPPAPPPPPSTLFSTIVTFAEFPLLVIAILMLALGWRKGPRGTTPPHFAGMLALLVGLLLLLLNNFQSGNLPAPGADQTVLILCLLYTVSALHGPRRLQWLIPPALLLAAIAFTFFH